MARGSLAMAAACALLAAGAAGTSGCRSDAAAPELDVAPAADSSAGGGRRLRRLSVREYVAVVRDLIDEDVDPARFLPETSDTGYDNGPANLTVQADQAETYEALATALAQAAVERHRDRLIGACDVDVAGVSTCKAALLDGFAARAFRRPLTPGEAGRIGALVDSAAALGNATEALEAAVSAMFQSPAFLYREELGAPGRPDQPTVRLTAFEAASELSFFLIGSMPDDALFAAAREGRLETAADLRREGARLLATPRGEDQLRHLLDQWLATDRIGAVAKDRAIYPKFDPELRRSMRGELDAFYTQVLAEGGALADVFGSTAGFVDPRLADLYGVPAPAAGSVARVELDPATRRGIMTRAGFLSVHSSDDGSGPIGRGVFVRSAILCAAPRPPPPNISRQVPGDPTRTTRERYAEHAKNPFCMGCHTAIDGVGFGFEQFDGSGALRDVENGAKVDTSGDLEDSRGGDGAFVGAGELEARILRGSAVTDCFARQVLRFALGVAEEERDEPSVQAIAKNFTARTRIADLALDVVTRRAFVERRIDEASGETPATASGPAGAP